MKPIKPIKKLIGVASIMLCLTFVAKAQVIPANVKADYCITNRTLCEMEVCIDYVYAVCDEEKLGPTVTETYCVIIAPGGRGCIDNQGKFYIPFVTSDDDPCSGGVEGNDGVKRILEAVNMRTRFTGSNATFPNTGIYQSSGTQQTEVTPVGSIYEFQQSPCENTDYVCYGIFMSDEGNLYNPPFEIVIVGIL